MAKAFHQLAPSTQEAKVRAALRAGEQPEPGGLTIYLALPESEVEAVAEVLQRMNGKPAHGDQTAPAPKGGRKGLTESRVRPVEPDYPKLPASKRAEAKRTYREALREFEDGEQPKAKGTKPTPAEVKEARAKAPAKATEKKAPATKRSTIAPPSGYAGWDDAKLAARVLKAKQAGKTIKEISADLGLEASERFWHRVSLVYRAAADAKSIHRPRRNGNSK